MKRNRKVSFLSCGKSCPFRFERRKENLVWIKSIVFGPTSSSFLLTLRRRLNKKGIINLLHSVGTRGSGQTSFQFQFLAGCRGMKSTSRSNSLYKRNRNRSKSERRKKANKSHPTQDQDAHKSDFFPFQVQRNPKMNKRRLLTFPGKKKE